MMKFSSSNSWAIGHLQYLFLSWTWSSDTCETEMLAEKKAKTHGPRKNMFLTHAESVLAHSLENNYFQTQFATWMYDGFII